MRASLLQGPALVTAGLVLAGFVLTFAAAAATSPVDQATVSLGACGAALVYALRRLYHLVRVLARPDALTQPGRGAGRFSQAELRDEKRRLLRAIKELEFDHGMGKLSQQDFESVIGTYRLRAIEVMRALEGEGELHPELRKLLAEKESAAPAKPPEVPPPLPELSVRAPEAAVEANLDRTSRICASCNGHNDNDARFCKHCGASLPRKGSAALDARSAVLASGEIA